MKLRNKFATVLRQTALLLAILMTMVLIMSPLTASAADPQSITDGSVVELESTVFLPAPGGQVIADTEWKGYTGTGFAKGFKVVGDALEFQANVVQSGSYDLVIKVNNGRKNDPKYDNSPRTGAIYMDDTKVKDMAFTVTATWGDASKNGVWISYTLDNVEITAGLHTFKIRSEGSNAGNYNLDSLTFLRHDTSKDAFAQTEAETADTLTNMTTGADGATEFANAAIDGAWLSFNEMKGEDKGGVEMRVKSSTGGSVIVYENAVGGKVLTTLTLPEDDQWTTISATAVDTDVVDSDIFLEFKAKDSSPLDVSVDWFKFIRAISDGSLLELEDGTGKTDDTNSKLRVDKEWPGYTGIGYVAGFKTVGNYVEFTGNVQQGGKYVLTLRGAAGIKSSPAFDNTPRTGALYIDGVKVADFGLVVQSSWGTWITDVFDEITIPAGIHTFKLVSEGSENSGNFNLDSVAFATIIDPDQAAADVVIAMINELDTAAPITTAKVNAVLAAFAAFENLTSTQQDLVTNAAALETALNAIKGDYTAVNTAITTIPANLDDYTAVSVLALEAAESAVVRGLYADSQTTIDGFATAINTAVSNLVLKVPADLKLSLGISSAKDAVTATTFDAVWSATLFIGESATQAAYDRFNASAVKIKEYGVFYGANGDAVARWEELAGNPSLGSTLKKIVFDEGDDIDMYTTYSFRLRNCPSAAKRAAMFYVIYQNGSQTITAVSAIDQFNTVPD